MSEEINIRPLTRLEQLEWLKRVLEEEIIRLEEELEECKEELEEEKEYMRKLCLNEIEKIYESKVGKE